MDDAILTEAQWEADGAQCLALSQSLVSFLLQAMGERMEWTEPQLSHTKVADCPY